MGILKNWWRMNEENKHALSKAEGLIHELRFPEFDKSGPWELSTIGKIGNFYYGKSALCG
jgi:hypothetical protein